MIGTSYNGTLPIAAATTGVEGLEAIVPIAPNTSYYHYYRSNGLIRHPGGYRARTSTCCSTSSTAAIPTSASTATRTWRDGRAARGIRSRRRRLQRLLGRARLPARSRADEGGDADGARVQRLERDARAQRAHLRRAEEEGRAVHRLLPPAGGTVASRRRSWSTAGSRASCTVSTTASRPAPRRGSCAKAIAARTRRPTRTTRTPTRRPSSCIRSREKGARSALSARRPRPIGAPQTAGRRPHGVRWQRMALAEDESPHRLLFATPELLGAVHLSGTASDAQVRRRSSGKPAANLSIWVVSLPWKPSRRLTDNIITRGWADPQNHESLGKSEPLVPGPVLRRRVRAAAGRSGHSRPASASA